MAVHEVGCVRSRREATAHGRDNTEAVAGYTVGDFRLTRVPYFDVPLGAQVIGFTAPQVLEADWGAPKWSTAEGQVLVGQAVWVIEAADATIVIDPCGASDAFLRTGPAAATHEAAVVAAMASAGVPIESVTTVVMSHLDGIGMVASRDEERGWHPFFPNPRILVSEPELAHVRAHSEISGSTALLSLVDEGFVDRISAPLECAPGLIMELTAGHSPGHCILRVGDGAVFIGHLAVNPIQVTGGVMPGAHHDPQRAFTALCGELAWASEVDALVIGPLWPDPGAGRVVGPPWRINPA